ncbi:uncharacterized protein LOC116260144 [Nymphaea colorata]|nr:uncharacterized protein LOC116260144 [Nymphaea colorata]
MHGSLEFEAMQGVKKWTVTYTKHLRQKRKVYQDGVLELSNSNQKILLYDDCGKLLDSRFLRKDEIVQCGGSLEFETHLVDVGDPDSSEKRANPDAQNDEEKLAQRITFKGQTISTLGSSKNIVQHKVGNLRNIASGTQDTVTEWHVLYTKQKSQKAKKFHDGILRLITSGHQRRKVILLSEDGMVLDSMHLKLSDDLNTGSSFELANYLVEIGKLQNCHESAASLVYHSKTSEQECNDSSKKTVFPSFSSQDKEKVSTNMDTATAKPLRNACQILFDLKKPTTSKVPGDNCRRIPMGQSLHEGAPKLAQSEATGEAEGAMSQNKMNPDDSRQDYKCQNSIHTASSSDQLSLVTDATNSLTAGFSDLVERDLKIRERFLSDDSASMVHIYPGSSNCRHFVTNEGDINVCQLDGANNGEAETQHGRKCFMSSFTAHGLPIPQHILIQR